MSLWQVYIISPSILSKNVTPEILHLEIDIRKIISSKM